MQKNLWARHSDMLTAAGVGATSLLLRLVPFFRYGGNPLGYDTGFYRRYLIEPLASFPNSPVPGLGDDALVPRMLLDALRALHVPTDVALYGVYIVLSSAIPVLLYYLLKRALGMRGAAVGGILLALSPVAYTAYWYFLFKNAFALCLVLTAAIFIEREAFWPVLLLDTLIALSHKTTAVVYIGMLGFLALISPKRFKEFGLHALATIALLGSVAFSALSDAARAVPVGIFLEWKEFLQFSIPFFIAIAFGAGALKALPIPKTLAALLAVGLAFPLLQLPFYERIFVFADIAFAALAGAAVEYMLRSIEKKERARTLYACALLVVIGSLIGSLWYQIKALKPLVSGNEMARVREIGALVPARATILTATDEAPWFEGWTLAHIAAPGMLKDIHNYEEWDAFWNATSTSFRISFLGGYPRPLYISTAEDYGYLASSTCMARVAPNLLLDSCAGTEIFK